ncbi:beta-glucosidase family protein [Synechococcus sp. CCY9202]|uniref:beta-glucosidase family protein n=1 Tax=Synechococcus sp. CCY9202 TaxID=174698 RepID=UPI002B219326|nr:glycoside hydrolase family 3 C-terminal domain-containing protein [Synechococcus sp. CCY9202]MEA5422611.1 glycoside hydrolase family 3 C-terminal domain-containing protein [Synechococcus sp. CCY9202]
MTDPAPDPASQARALSLLAEMSLAEKLHLLDGDTPFWAGMVDIATRDASHRHPWPTGCLPRLGLKGLQFVDGPRGVVLEGGATTFPVPIARGATWDPELEERIGEAIAREARSFGADWVAAVCVNLLRHPGWGRAQETYGEDPVHLGAMGAAMTRGLQRHAIACVKHFALNSIDSSRFLVDVRASQRVLHELYLPHFRDCVKAGAGSVMSAYNRVNGEWCGQHPQLLQDILKTRWDFGGFVVTDFIFGVRDGVRALLAGQDLEMPFRMIFEGSLSEAVADGRLPIQRIDEAVLQLLQAQLTVPPGSYPMSLRHCADHRQLAREAATKSIVLLKNEGSVLPLRGLHSLAVIGPYLAVANLGDRGSSDTRPEPGSVVTPLAGLQAAAPELRLEVADGADLRAATALAAKCDAALLVLGLDWRLEGEHIHPGDIAPILQQVPPPDGLLRLGRSRVLPLWRPVARLIAWITSYGSARRGGDFAAGDRTGLDLPPEQVALIEAVAAANPRTVVVLMGGGAILTEGWHDRVPGLLLLWYPGQRGGEALADVLLGRVSPSGRLPFTIPTNAAHLPPFEPRAQQVTYDLWHGYRRLRREGHRAAYPFGYGLSYSRFELADLTAAIQPQAGEEGELVVEVTVRNGGAMEADEVVQVYLEPPGRQVERPARVLVGFQRASLAMAEQRRLVLRIPLRRLAYFEESSDGFVLEPGLHRLVVARHAEDAGLALELQVEGRILGR